MSGHLQRQVAYQRALIDFARKARGLSVRESMVLMMETAVIGLASDGASLEEIQRVSKDMFEQCEQAGTVPSQKKET